MHLFLERFQDEEMMDDGGERIVDWLLLILRSPNSLTRYLEFFEYLPGRID